MAARATGRTAASTASPPTARSLTSRAFNFSFPALDTSRAWRSQKTSSVSDRARASHSPSIRTCRWSRRDSLDSVLALSLMLCVLSLLLVEALVQLQVLLVAPDPLVVEPGDLLA